MFVQLTECRGNASCRIEIQHADTGQVVARTKPRIMSLPSDPLEVYGMSFRIRNCLFLTPGLYSVQLWYNEHVIEQQHLILR